MNGANSTYILVPISEQTTFGPLEPVGAMTVLRDPGQKGIDLTTTGWKINHELSLSQITEFKKCFLYEILLIGLLSNCYQWSL